MPVVGYPRPVVRGGTYALTKRTAFRKAFLAPWDPLVMQTWLYVLAGAQHRTGVSIHHTMLNVSHQHTSVSTSEKANLPRFTEYAHREMSKAVNVLLAARRYEAPRQVFEDRQTHQMRLLDAPACMSHILYERLNGVAAGLVAKPEHMPGCRFDFALWRGEPLVIKRPPLYFNPKTTETERELYFDIDPLTYLEFGGDIDAIVHHFRRTERLGVQAFRRARRFPVLGAKKLRRIHPYNEPRTNRETGRRLVPTFKLGARGVSGRVARIHACQEVTAFRAEHADAQTQRRRGREALYPAGTYKMRVEHDVDVAAPGASALVTAPGLTLGEAKQRVDRFPAGVPNAPDQVASAFADEAASVLQQDRMSFRGGDEPVGRSPNEPTVDVQHRLESRRESHASRVVVLRDHRRGRPSREPPE
ncbi:MAG: hypothetical protein AAGE52_20435 [Myxococcota bacterium]